MSSTHHLEEKAKSKLKTKGLKWLGVHPKEVHAHNAYTYKHLEDIIKFLHQCLFSPTKKTLLKTLANNHFLKWPEQFNVKTVKQFLEESPATFKFYLGKIQKGVRSTCPIRKKTKKEIIKQYNITLEDL